MVQEDVYSFFLMKKLSLVVVALFLLTGCSLKNIGASIFSLDENPAQADLTISSAAFSSINSQGKVKLDLVIENKGRQGVEKEFFVFGSWPENPSLSTVVLFPISGGLAAGASKTYSQVLDLPDVIGKSGRYKFSADRCFQASCNDLVKESDENNNSLTIHFDL